MVLSNNLVKYHLTRVFIAYCLNRGVKQYSTRIFLSANFKNLKPKQILTLKTRKIACG